MAEIMTPTIRVSFTARLSDSNGIAGSAVVNAYVDDTVTDAQLSDTWAAALDALTDGVITGGRITLPDRRMEQAPSGLKTVAVLHGQWLPESMLFSFGGYQYTGYAHSVLVPAFSKRFIWRRYSNDGIAILESAPVQAFIKLLSEPFAAGHGVFTDPDGRQLVGDGRHFQHVTETQRNLRWYNRQLRHTDSRPAQ